MLLLFHQGVAVSSRGKSVVSGDALLAAGLYSAAVSNATYVLSTRGFCREMIHGDKSVMKCFHEIVNCCCTINCLGSNGMEWVGGHCTDASWPY